MGDFNAYCDARLKVCFDPQISLDQASSKEPVAPDQVKVDPRVAERKKLFAQLAASRKDQFVIDRRRPMNPLAQMGKLGLTLLSVPLALPGCSAEGGLNLKDEQIPADPVDPTLTPESPNTGTPSQIDGELVRSLENFCDAPLDLDQLNDDQILATCADSLALGSPDSPSQVDLPATVLGTEVAANASTVGEKYAYVAYTGIQDLNRSGVWSVPLDGVEEDGVYTSLEKVKPSQFVPLIDSRGNQLLDMSLNTVKDIKVIDQGDKKLLVLTSANVQAYNDEGLPTYGPATLSFFQINENGYPVELAEDLLYSLNTFLDADGDGVQSEEEAATVKASATVPLTGFNPIALGVLDNQQILSVTQDLNDSAVIGAEIQITGTDGVPVNTVYLPFPIAEAKQIPVVKSFTDALGQVHTGTYAILAKSKAQGAQTEIVFVNLDAASEDFGNFVEVKMSSLTEQEVVSLNLTADQSTLHIMTAAGELKVLHLTGDKAGQSSADNIKIAQAGGPCLSMVSGLNVCFSPEALFSFKLK